MFDNIPLTALALKQGGYDWGVLAYAVRFGGSMIGFGSSAGVALSNMYPETRARFHVHFTPTYSSWLNQVERWFALITNHSIRRGSFELVTELKRQINAYVEHYNQHPKPFMWTATGDSILAKLERLCNVLNGTQH